MKKKVVLLLSMVVLFFSAKSQLVALSVGPDVAISAGKLKDGYSVGVGGTVKGEVGIPLIGRITAQSGYINFFGKNDVKDMGLVPLKFGLQYKLPVIPIYVEPQAGVDMWKPKGEDNSNSFAYAFNAGIRGASVDLSGRYEGSKISGQRVHFWGIRLAWRFGLL